MDQRTSSRSSRQSSRRANVVHLGQFTQILRDAEYGRLPKVLESLKQLQDSEIAAVGANVIVRGIERCTPAKLPALLDIIDLVADRASVISDGSTATMGCTTTFPLVRASYHGLTPVVERLLTHGAKLAHVAGHSASTMESAMSAAVRTNRLGTLGVLLRVLPTVETPGERSPHVFGLLVQSLWLAFEKQNVPACNALVARGATVDDVFASVLCVLECSKKFQRFAADMVGARAPLVIGRPRPWHLPPAYVRGVLTLRLCLRRSVAAAPLPAEVFDHIVSFLPRDPTCFIDEATLRANLPRRDYTSSSSLFAILSRPRHRNGEFA